MPKRVTVVLPWDLDPTLAAFPKKPADGELLVLETKAKVNALPWHRQKLTLVVSALRHFTEERRAAGFTVHHVVAEDYASGIEAFSRAHPDVELHVTAAREWAIDQRLNALSLRKRGEGRGEGPGASLTIHDDGGPGGHFLITRDEFRAWASTQKGQLRMDRFYPELRKKLNLLLDKQGKPIGGKWSFDADNREHARGVEMPAIPWFEPDAMTKQVMRWVKVVGAWGQLEPFGWPVTRAQALSWLDHFIKHRLPHFGRYEDAIRSDERFLFHSLLSVPLNLGLLRPEELARAAAKAYERGDVELASAEGFIRQVIGWREFIRGVYWHLMPGLRSANQLDAKLPLPDFFWEPEKTQMQCLKEAVSSVEQTGYTHHIERLMVICNYATLAGLDPRPVSNWFWAAFADAYEWVELPNVVGMGMHGTAAFTTKPYVASAAYIKRQSGMSAKGRGPKDAKDQAPCARCRFDPDQRVGDDACPYNTLYWDFLDTHRARLSKNVRMQQLIKNLDRFGDAQLNAIRETAKKHRAGLKPAEGYVFEEDAG
ncbi:MAG TPA: cryptochrome/photolyase family protein [Archangium sp.]